MLMLMLMLLLVSVGIVMVTYPHLNRAFNVQVFFHHKVSVSNTKIATKKLTISLLLSLLLQMKPASPHPGSTSHSDSLIMIVPMVNYLSWNSDGRDIGIDSYRNGPTVLPARELARW